MGLLQEADKAAVSERFAGMTGEVKLINFTQELECQYCRETRQLLEEISELSDKISLDVYNFVTDKEKVEEFGIDKIPATVIMAEKDCGIRFYGIPTGYEFATLLEDILMVSSGDSGLSPNSKELIRALTDPLHMQVFITPTCPYCPAAVRLAHQIAMENDVVRADMVEATEFPQLSMKYGVRGVPMTVVNEKPTITGALPEEAFVTQALSAMNPKAT